MEGAGLKPFSCYSITETFPKYSGDRIVRKSNQIKGLTPTKKSVGITHTLFLVGVGPLI